MRFRHALRFFFLLVIGSFLLVPALAQTTQLRGRVFDEFGASIPDASVSFEPLDPRPGLTAFAAVADSRGRFDFASVRPGTYRVICKALGFETTIVTYDVTAGVENDFTVVVRRRSSFASHHNATNQ